jgi:flavorubredoxin
MDTATDTSTDTTIDEIADGIYRISTYVPEVAPPLGFTMNQFLVVADEPMLFHTGPRGMFPLVAEAVATVIPVESVRWISFGHVESDECGSMNAWLAAAPQSNVVHGELGCFVSLDDMCDRPPRPMAEGDVLDLGGKRLRFLATPHVPHGWEAITVYEETTRTLLCGDLLTHLGTATALTSDDVVAPALEAEAMFHASTMAPHTGAVLRSLGDLEPTTLAIMHGSAYEGDGKQALYDLAAGYEAMTAAS